MALNKNRFLGFGSTGLSVPVAGMNVLFASPVAGVTIRNTGSNSLCVVVNSLLVTTSGDDDYVAGVFPSGAVPPTSQEFRRSTVAEAAPYAFVIPAGGSQRFTGYGQVNSGPLISSIAMWSLVAPNIIMGGQDDVTVA